MRTNAARLAPLGVTCILFCKEERALRTQAWEGVQGGRLPPLEDFFGFSGYNKVFCVTNIPVVVVVFM